MYLVIAQLCNYQFFKSNIHIYIMINILNQEVASNYPISWRFQWPVRMQMLGGDRCRFGHQPRIYNWNSKLNHLIFHQSFNLLFFTYSILYVHTINPNPPPLYIFLWGFKYVSPLVKSSNYFPRYILRTYYTTINHYH